MPYTSNSFESGTFKRSFILAKGAINTGQQHVSPIAKWNNFYRQPPTISGAQARYRRGEEVELNCTVAATMPPANISWYINHRLVSS